MEYIFIMSAAYAVSKRRHLDGRILVERVAQLAANLPDD